jgi:cell division protein FtsB
VRKILPAILSLALPGMLFLNAWQGFRYTQLSDEVVDLEKRQKELLEANRDTIAQIAREQSPDMVEQKAISDLKLEPLDQSHVTRVVVEGANDGGQGP